MSDGSNGSNGHDGATRRVERDRGGGGGFSLLVVGPSGVSSHPLPASGSVVVGRGESSDVRIVDDSVSRSHARIELGHPVRVTDLGSANGVWVRGRRLEQDEVADVALGEMLELGTVMVAVQLGEPSLGRDGWIADESKAVLAIPEAAATDLPGVVCADPASRRVLDLVRRVAKSNLSVLLLGETGAGKEVFAEALHRASDRASGPYLKLNCAAIAPSLLEAELFGHEKGAFTGATDTRPGLVESADRGTLFLDEIGELPLDLQPKLLRVIEEREVMRVGARRARAVDVRFVAATNRDLASDAAAGRFRRDLYYRLNGISIRIPPLRDRPGDVVALAEKFLAGTGKGLSPGAAGVLAGHDWPGNVRELRNTIGRAVVIAGDATTIEAAHVVLDDDAAIAFRTTLEQTGERALDEDTERARIEDALARCAGNQTRAAHLLGISRRTLVNKLERYGITRPRKK